MKPLIKIEKTVPHAKIPFRAKPTDAGADLSSIERVTIFQGQRALVRTGIKMAIPEGWYGRIAERSGLALKQGIEVLGGVVDSDYRGEIGVILYNNNPKPEAGFSLDGTFVVNPGDRIAQIIIEKCMLADFEEGDLNSTDRGEGGFGSTGI